MSIAIGLEEISTCTNTHKTLDRSTHACMGKVYMIVQTMKKVHTYLPLYTIPPGSQSLGLTHHRLKQLHRHIAWQSVPK